MVGNSEAEEDCVVEVRGRISTHETACHLFEVLVLSDLVPHGLRGWRADQPLPVRHLNLQTLATEILYLLKKNIMYIY